MKKMIIIILAIFFICCNKTPVPYIPTIWHDEKDSPINTNMPPEERSIIELNTELL